MANVQHNSLTGADLHEPKGIASATADQIYIADGAGSGTWTDNNTLTTMAAHLHYMDGPASSNSWKYLYDYMYVPFACEVDSISYRGIFTENFSGNSASLHVINQAGTTIWSSSIAASATVGGYVGSGSLTAHSMSSGQYVYIRYGLYKAITSFLPTWDRVNFQLYLKAT